MAAKVAAAQRWGMTAIVCVGEQVRTTMDEVVAALGSQLGALTAADPDRLVIAYEPAWAIGVGATAAPVSWVGAVHEAIRRTLAQEFPGPSRIPIIYGGSVSPKTAGALLSEPLVDGLFVGRQALDPHVYTAIARTPIG